MKENEDEILQWLQFVIYNIIGKPKTAYRKRNKNYWYKCFLTGKAQIKSFMAFGRRLMCTKLKGLSHVWQKKKSQLFIL